MGDIPPSSMAGHAGMRKNTGGEAFVLRRGAWGPWKAMLRIIGPHHAVESGLGRRPRTPAVADRKPRA